MLTTLPAAVTAPPQPLLRPLGVATISPEGRLSVKRIPLFPAVAAVMMNLSDVLPPTSIALAPNDLVI
jgi:hypothetical protein